jgi:hypothetical protein
MATRADKTDVASRGKAARAGAQGAKDGGLEPEDGDAALARRGTRKRGAASVSGDPVVAETQLAVKIADLDEQETGSPVKRGKQRRAVILRWLKESGLEPFANLPSMKPSDLQEALTKLRISLAAPVMEGEDEGQQVPPASRAGSEDMEDAPPQYEAIQAVVPPSGNTLLTAIAGSNDQIGVLAVRSNRVAEANHKVAEATHSLLTQLLDVSRQQLVVSMQLAARPQPQSQWSMDPLEVERQERLRADQAANELRCKCQQKAINCLAAEITQAEWEKLQPLTQETEYEAALTRILGRHDLVWDALIDLPAIPATLETPVKAVAPGQDSQVGVRVRVADTAGASPQTSIQRAKVEIPNPPQFTGKEDNRIPCARAWLGTVEAGMQLKQQDLASYLRFHLVGTASTWFTALEQRLKLKGQALTADFARTCRTRSPSSPVYRL